MKYLVLITSIFILQSCGKNIELGKSNLNLENIDMNLNVHQFYANEIEKEQKYEEQKDKILEKIHSKKHTDKEFQDFDEILSILNDFNLIEIDTIYSGDKYYGNIGNPLGIQYNMRSWSPNDSLAYYENMHFEKIDMMKSLDGNFIALVATNESKDETNLKELINLIESKNGKAHVYENEFFGSYYVYSWEMKDRILAISSKYDNKKNTLKLGVEHLDGKIQIDTSKQSTINTNLFILNNKFKNDSIILKLNSGDWLYFKDIFENYKGSTS